MPSKVVNLQCKANNYAWGKDAKTSAVAALIAGAQEVDPNKLYSELWMGTHKTNPSMVVDAKGSTIKPLSDHIGGQLPFLFKVLSINKCLSIQAHPDKKLAEKLHAMRATSYKDDNHKPEMACAVTPFEAMCGFRPMDEILFHLRTYPEFRAAVGESAAAALEKATDGTTDSLGDVEGCFKKLFENLCRTDKKALTGLQEKLMARLATGGSSRSGGPKEQDRCLDVEMVVQRLFKQYPPTADGADNGVFAPFLLNCFKCEPGEAIFLPANEPHAYMSGDIVETMASSDNVVRVGCTPKEKDVDTLVKMLTYKHGMPNVMSGDKLDDYTRRYVVPIDEFQLTRTELPANTVDYTLKGHQGSDALLLVYVGSGKLVDGDAEFELKKGTVLAAPAGLDLKITSGAEPLRIFRCYAPATAKL